MDEDNSAFPEEKKNCPVTVQLTAGEKEQLQTLAANRGTSQSAVARKYITQGMEGTIIFTPGEILPVEEEDSDLRFFIFAVALAWIITLTAAFFVGKILA